MLQYGLKHGLCTKPKEYNILASTESVWKQIDKLELYTDNQHAEGCAKVALKALSYSLLDLEDDGIFTDL